MLLGKFVVVALTVAETAKAIPFRSETLLMAQKENLNGLSTPFAKIFCQLELEGAFIFLQLERQKYSNVAIYLGPQ